MSKKSSIGTTLSGQGTISGILYLAFQIFVLADILNWCNLRFGFSLNNAELNLVYYLINFIAMLLIFHNYLSSSLHQAAQHPILLLEAVILGLVAYYALSWLTTRVIQLLVPAFTNYNDASISAMSRGNFFLIFIGTVILVPPVEECFFRGLIFRSIYGKNRPAAYIVSIMAFAAIHILGYIGKYSPVELLMACLQYLPAGLCLAWSYARGGTVFAPILIHAAINYIAISNLR